MDVIKRAGRDYPLTIEEVDITTDPALYERYRYVIPVVAIDGVEALVSKVSEVWLRRALREAGARERPGGAR